MRVLALALLALRGEYTPLVEGASLLLASYAGNACTAGTNSTTVRNITTGACTYDTNGYFVQSYCDKPGATYVAWSYSSAVCAPTSLLALNTIAANVCVQGLQATCTSTSGQARGLPPSPTEAAFAVYKTSARAPRGGDERRRAPTARRHAADNALTSARLPLLCMSVLVALRAGTPTRRACSAMRRPSSR
jgi:hypothetical protein